MDGSDLSSDRSVVGSDIVLGERWIVLLIVLAIDPNTNLPGTL